MEKTFVAVDEPRPGGAWKRHFETVWPRVRVWYLKEGLASRPTPAEGRAAIARHMPELLPMYDALCGLVGTDEIAHRMLSNYNPPAIIAACSQAAWTGAGGPALVHNYDFDVSFTTGCIESTRWFGRRVIAMQEAAWGCLDGMNEDGLVVSLTFGGRPARGHGFSMPLVLRYVLETCRTVGEAVAVIARSIASRPRDTPARGPDGAGPNASPQREPRRRRRPDHRARRGAGAPPRGSSPRRPRTARTAQSRPPTRIHPQQRWQYARTGPEMRRRAARTGTCGRADRRTRDGALRRVVPARETSFLWRRPRVAVRPVRHRSADVGAVFDHDPHLRGRRAPPFVGSYAGAP